jgi:hypothetical protein
MLKFCLCLSSEQNLLDLNKDGNVDSKDIEFGVDKVSERSGFLLVSSGGVARSMAVESLRECKMMCLFTDALYLHRYGTCWSTTCPRAGDSGRG